ncbi:hypothetical protein G5714_004500 [Onychostoma macrolepis]|uniref:Uncharacterized protein n=1 Tax=Onychostoma macrolepis TaxID=369639 RepID=A0A7J6D4X2_9TELE|nr:hypothetical protein G5714_004500 [Onychostoma macrolepis]
MRNLDETYDSGDDQVLLNEEEESDTVASESSLHDPSPSQPRSSTIWRKQSQKPKQREEDKLEREKVLNERCVLCSCQGALLTIDGCAAQRDLEQVVFGIYSINAEGGDATTTPVDVGIVIEGVEVLHDLGDNASACALLMGVIYAMNLN